MPASFYLKISISGANKFKSMPKYRGYENVASPVCISFSTAITQASLIIFAPNCSFSFLRSCWNPSKTASSSFHCSLQGGGALSVLYLLDFHTLSGDRICLQSTLPGCRLYVSVRSTSQYSRNNDQFDALHGEQDNVFRTEICAFLRADVKAPLT